MVEFELSDFVTLKTFKHTGITKRTQQCPPKYFISSCKIEGGQLTKEIAGATSKRLFSV